MLETKSDPFDKLFPRIINLDNEEQNDILEDILAQLKNINSNLAIIGKVLLIYSEANPPKKKVKNVKND